MFVAGCGRSNLVFEAVPIDARQGSELPNLSENFPLLLSWVEPEEDGYHRLRYANVPGGEARTVARGTDWFVNWADFPSVVSLGNNTRFAHSLFRRGASSHGYDFALHTSQNNGESWSSIGTPYTDSTDAQHGFVALAPWEPGALMVWLDGRDTEGPMTLRGAMLSESGDVSSTHILDQRVCSCCQTSAARTDSGLVVVYRDRSENEIRDISSIVLTPEGFSEPRPVHDDGWEIYGCPG